MMWMINQAKCIKHVPFEKMAAAWKDTHLVRINQENTQSMLDNSRTIAIRKDISGLNLRVYIILFWQAIQGSCDYGHSTHRFLGIIKF